MESIPQELSQELEKLFESIMGFNVTQGISPEFKKVEDAIKKFLKFYAERQLQELDEIILNSRPEDWRVVKKGVGRKLESEIGLVEYKRRYYRNDETGCYAYLTDMVAQIEKGSKVDIGLALKLVEYAGDNSYAKSSQLVCGGKVSKQSIMKFVQRVHDYELPEDSPRPTVKEIHIQADEDHVALQTGSSTITKLITVHEPSRKYKKKVWLPEKRHFTGYKEKPMDLWERTEDYIYERYNNDVKVYIHGDGASWIKTGLEVIPGSEFIIDRFHLHRKVNRVSADNFLYKCKIFQYFRHDDYDSLKVFLNTIVANDEVPEEVAEEAYKYFMNNRDGIRNLLKLPGNIVRSCAEGQVSHVLSDRLSSRPKAWMADGLEAVAQVRVFQINGGKLMPDHLRKKNEVLEKHNEKIKQLRREKASYLYYNNFDINKLMPKASNNRFLKDIARGLNRIS